ncbi:MAG: hypothetical protein ABW148_04050 [Sedimenticola sp.]
MKLNIIIHDHSMDLEIPDQFIESSSDAFDRLDTQMDKGAQSGQEWIDKPDQHQRCQIAADKLLTALETDNHGLAMISAGYIVSRMPDIKRVRIDTSGEPNGTGFE